MTHLHNLAMFYQKQFILLPKTLENSLLEHFKSHYESELSIDWSFCRYLWEAHINVSHINIEDIESVVTKTIK